MGILHHGSRQGNLGLGLVYVVAFNFYTAGITLFFSEPLIHDVAFQLSNTITQWGSVGLGPSNSYPNFWGGYLTFNVLLHSMGLTGEQTWNFAKAFPLVSSIIMCSMIYSVAHAKIQDLKSTIPPILVTSLMWSWVTTLSTLSYGLILYLCVLVLAFSSRGRMKTVFLVFLFSFVSAFSSPESPIYLMLFLVSAVVLGAYTSVRRKTPTSYSLAEFAKYAVVSFSAYSSWWIFGSPAALYGNATFGIQVIKLTVANLVEGRISSISIGRSGAQLSSMSGQLLVSSDLKYLVTALQIGLLLYTAVVLRKANNFALLLAAGFAPFVWGIYGLFTGGGYSEDVIAVSLFGLAISLAALISRGAKKPLLVLVLSVLLLGAFLLPVTRYSVSATSYYSQAEITGAQTIMLDSNLFPNGVFNSGGNVRFNILPDSIVNTSLGFQYYSLQNSLASGDALVFDKSFHNLWASEASSGEIYATSAARIAGNNNVVYSDLDLVLVVPR